MALELTLFGPPQVRVDGAPLQVDTRKAVALLIDLVVGGERQPRERLAARYWSTSSEERARASLRRTLSVLSSGLGGRWLSADRHEVSLDRSQLTCDVLEFRRLRDRATGHDHEDPGCQRCRHDLTAAAELYRGDFLEGFAVRDAPEFEDWQLLEAEVLRREVGTLLERLVVTETAAGALASALEHARRWVALDPLHERAHREVMRLADDVGRRDEAIRQYRECVAVLDRELGVAPLPETTALHDAILAAHDHAPTGRAGADPSPAAAPPATKGSVGLPLLGREADLERLRRAHVGAVRSAVLTAVRGEAGIGKTRLATEFADEVRARGGAAVTTRCYEGESRLACAAFTDLLRGAFRRDQGWVHELPATVVTEVARLLPEVAELRDDLQPARPLGSPGAQAGFFAGIWTALDTALDGPVAGLVVIDDAHWADVTTLDLLGYLARRPDAAAVLVLLAWRPEAVSHGHPLERLAPEGAAPLRRLAAGEVAHLVEVAAPSVAHLADRLFEETWGIPLFVAEYLRVVDDGGTWELPVAIRDLVRARLRPLTELARQVLTAAAAIGRGFDTDVLVRTSGRTDDEVVTALDELLAADLVREDHRRGRFAYDVSHPRVRDVVYEDASLARRRLLHRRAGEALATTSSRGGLADAALAANHLQAAGLDAAAAEQHALAADRARELYANPEALAHVQAALALGHPDVVRLQRTLGELHTLAGRYADAVAAFDVALAHTDEPTTAAQLERRLGGVHLRAGDWSRAATHLQVAADALAGGNDPSEHARALADLALATARGGDVTSAVPLGVQAVEVATAAGDGAARAQAHNVLGVLARAAGDPDGAQPHLDDSLRWADATDDRSARVAALNNLALIALDRGDAPRAIERLQRALEDGTDLGDRHREAAILNNLADAYHAAGREEEAMDHLKRAVAIFAEIDEPGRPQPEIWKLADW